MTRAGDSLRQWLEAAPPGTTVLAEEILARLETPAVTPDESAQPPTAAERLWSCPPNTRYTVKELAAALHRPKTYIYSLTAAKAIPFCKLDGHLVFIASEIRSWLEQREERINGNGMIRRVN